MRRDGADRHGTLRATVEWSYQLVDSAAQQVFDRLGVFAAAVDLAASPLWPAATSSTSSTSSTRSTTLVDHSLVVAEVEDGTTRYRLLDTMRAFARERLAARGELDRIARAHAEWAAERVAQLNEALIAPDEVLPLIAVDDMERFWPDLRAAVTLALDGRDADLAARLLGTFTADAIFREREELATWLDDASSLPGILEPSARCALCSRPQPRSTGASVGTTPCTSGSSSGQQLRDAGFDDPRDELRSAQVLYMIVAGRLAKFHRPRGTERSRPGTGRHGCAVPPQLRRDPTGPGRVLPRQSIAGHRDPR